MKVAAPTTGGPPVSYTVTAADSTSPGRGGQTCTVSGPTNGSCTVTRLTNGDSYTFTDTATNPAGTSASSPASNPVTPKPVTPADIAVSLSGPTHAPDGSAFTENVTVSNLGPGVANGVATNLLIPAGLTVTAAPGATKQIGTLDWVDPSLAATKSIVYPVTVEVSGYIATVEIGVVTEANGNDPTPMNNVAITTFQLGS